MDGAGRLPTCPPSPRLRRGALRKSAIQVWTRRRWRAMAGKRLRYQGAGYSWGAGAMRGRLGRRVCRGASVSNGERALRPREGGVAPAHAGLPPQSKIGPGWSCGGWWWLSKKWVSFALWAGEGGVALLPPSGGHHSPRWRLSGEALRGETDGEFDGGVFGVDAAGRGANDEGRLGPGLAAKSGREMIGTGHGEEGKEGRVAFAQDDGAPTDDDQRGGGGGFGALELGGGKDAGEEAARREMGGGEPAQ